MIFFENVKGLLTHDKRQFLFDILQELAELGYFVKWKMINAKHYGPPQNRERVYFVGFRNFCEYKNFDFPDIKSTFEQRCQRKVECIDLNKTVENCYYAGNAGRAGKRAIEQVRSFDFGVGDMFLWRINRMCKISEDMIPTLVHESSLFCHCPFIVDCRCRLRSLTAEEGAHIQGFLQDYKFNMTLSPRVIFGLIGNSVSIWTVKMIFEQIAEALSNGQHEQK